MEDGQPNKKKMSDTQQVLILAGGLFGVALIAAVIFVILWHHRGDVYAQAMGSLLLFATGVLATLTTILYLHFTHRALKEAQRANRQQREQWEHKVRVVPRFWLYPTERKFYMMSGQSSASGMPIYLDYDGYEFIAWNPGEQSFLVNSVELSIVEFGKFRNERIELNRVIRPNSTDHKDISETLLKLLCDRNVAAPLSLLGTLPTSPVTLAIRIRYTDWQKTDVYSEILELTAEIRDLNATGFRTVIETKIK